ncbi:MAG: trypsin-like peptidase domain-containing protein [Planctomycetaceae bacterium]|nr:trypsin-like peptidase domain-containing protein [Planctomycetaceae bacterium]
MTIARYLFLLTIGLVIGSFNAGLQAADTTVLEAQQKRIEVIDKVSDSVVAIFSASGEGGGGSGVLISKDGYALSNFHVTSGAGDFMKCGLNDGNLYDAVIVGIDPTGDVALLKLLGRDDFPVAEIGNSDNLQAGDWVYAMGNPFLLATDFKPTVTYGIVSGVHRYQYPAGTILEYTDCIQTDSSINPGNSGGPLFNDDGELVGINGRGSFEKRGRVNSGAGYAISINQIMNFLGHLKSGRVVDHATLGATVTSLSDGSVVVETILEDSEAYRRGLRQGDEIVSFAGRPIRSVNQYKNILGIYPKGWKLPLEFRRNQEKQTIRVRLRGLHNAAELIPGEKKKIEPPPEKKPNSDEQKPAAKENPIPKPFQGLYEKKTGYANYEFNRREQNRVLATFNEWGDYASRNGSWVLTGRNVAGTAFKMELDQEKTELTLGKKTWTQTFDGAPLTDAPENSGGLLVALYHLRLFLTHHGFLFSEFQYLGTEPLDGLGNRVDVLTSELTSVESRWYFDDETGQFLGFDTQVRDDLDECEVRFGEIQAFEDLQFPSGWTIHSGGEQYDQWTIESINFSPGPKPAGKQVTSN